MHYLVGFLVILMPQEFPIMHAKGVILIPGNNIRNFHNGIPEV